INRRGFVKFDSVSRDDWLLAGVAFLLVIDLLFLPWFSASVSIGSFSASFTATATDAPDGAFGVLAVLSAVLLIADLAVERLSPGTTVPNIGGSRTQTRFVLACITALFVALKFVFNIHFSDFGFGFYAAVVLTVGLVWVAFQTRSGTSVVGNIHVGR
ncbi:MAG: hypothetical protein WAU75_00310, partial [Solirubrobacteraceae bacterium]